MISQLVNEKGFIQDPYRNFIHVSRYARWLDSEYRREKWVETVERYMNFMKKHLVKNHGLSEDNPTFQEVHKAILNMDILPSMRALMAAGPALEQDHICAYNCSFIAVDSLRAFDEAMYILMNGTGVGFSVEQEHVKCLPIIADEFYPTETTIVVEDSKLGWAKAFKELIALLTQGQIPKWDMRKVRPAGARLKTFGGRASGPEPLNELFNFTAQMFKNARGRKLKTIEAHDIMCKIGEVVVVGGVRRSALISLSNLDDFEMAKSKGGQWWESQPQRRLANNSAVYENKPTVAQFLREWRNLYESKSGERGIYNLSAVRKHIAKFGRRDPDLVRGTNPCVTSDTWILTSEGAKQVSDLIGKPFVAMVNGKQYKTVSNGFFFTGTKQIVELATNEGYSVKLTKDHKVLTPSGWKEAGALSENESVMIHDHQNSSWNGQGTFEDGYVIGHLIGDGTFGEKAAFLQCWDKDKGSETVKDFLFSVVKNKQHRSDWKGWFLTSNKTCWRMQSKGITELARNFGVIRGSKTISPQIEQSSSSFYTGFIQGLFDTDGHIEGKGTEGGITIRLSNTDLNLLQGVQRMLARLGVISSIKTLYKKGNYFKAKNGYPEYEMKESFRLIISGHYTEKFMEAIGFRNHAKAKKWETIFQEMKRGFYNKKSIATVKSILPCGEQDVYDVTVADVHCFDGNGFVLHNCGEILLRNLQFCNLTEIVIRPEDTKETLMAKTRLATILGTWQSTLTNFKYIRKTWKKNCEEERLLGVSLTGIFGNKLTSTNGPELASLLDEMRLYAVEVNEQHADMLGIEQSAAITCVKPSGTVSQLTGVSSGIHPWFSEYFIRTVRGDNKDPVTTLLKNAGVPHEPDIMKPDNTTVFSFPRKAPENSLVSRKLSAIEHLELWKTYREHWTEHNPSVTIYIREEEWMDVGAWVYRNFNSIGGIAFLPASEHVYKQAPYQEISEQEYHDFLEKMPKDIDWESLSVYELEDTTTGTQELACVGGVCSIDDDTSGLQKI